MCILFGSYAKGKEREKSEIDIGIYIDEELFNDSKKILDLQLEHMINLSDMFHKEVDLVILNDASPLLRHEVISD